MPTESHSLHVIPPPLPPPSISLSLSASTIIGLGFATRYVALCNRGRRVAAPEEGVVSAAAG